MHASIATNKKEKKTSKIRFFLCLGGKKNQKETKLFFFFLSDSLFKEFCLKDINKVCKYNYFATTAGLNPTTRHNRLTSISHEWVNFVGQHQ